MRAAKALARLRGCADLSDHWLAIRVKSPVLANIYALRSLLRGSVHVMTVGQMASLCSGPSSTSYSVSE